MKNKLYIIALLNILSGQTLEIGDIVPNFSIPSCSNYTLGNDDLTWSLYDYNGATNGGNPSVILVTVFASW